MITKIIGVICSLFLITYGWQAADYYDNSDKTIKNMFRVEEELDD